MTTGGVLSRVIGQLEQANIPSMVAGSFASTYHGVPRTTNDIDIVIAPTAQSLAQFLDRLPEQEYYASREAAMDALRRSSMFNVIDLESGWKVDLIIRKSRPFSLEEFRRRVAARLFEVPVFVATAEDTILTKLEWAAMGESERQMRDAAGIVSVKATELDHEYISRWAIELGVADQWRRLNKDGI